MQYISQRDMKTGWLSTSETAKHLGVSEASVRRWSDRGTLPVHRVGKRLERRFKPEDVERFVAPERPGPPPLPADKDRVVLGSQTVDVSTHLATLYDSDAARTRLTAPFLADGIRAGQPSFLMAHGEDLAGYMDALDEMPDMNLDAAIASGVLTIAAAPGSTAREALAYFEKVFWAAVDRHATVIRLVGEMGSVRDTFTSEREMLDFESMFNMVGKRLPCVAVCQYDVRKFSGQAVLAALRAHPDILDASIGLLLK
jgi:excisionase family DNA binding protein